MSTGYSPKGHQPEPTTAPPTPAPVAAAPAPDAFAAMAARLKAMHDFLWDRSQEEPVTPRFQWSLGYAFGAGEECVRQGDIVGAVRRLEWLTNEAKQWDDHPNYPAWARP
ncbi:MULTISPECIES: hypothetical protein [unclassified Streptomyces]|uniref:hypothetical protein n=1 Tax=unclassified Streptomyces TaxID=2593676 RepID=UPI003332B52C